MPTLDVKKITLRNDKVTLTDLDGPTVSRLRIAGMLVKGIRASVDVSLDDFDQVAEPVKAKAAKAGPKAAGSSCITPGCGKPGASRRKGRCTEHYEALPPEEKVRVGKEKAAEQSAPQT